MSCRAVLYTCELFVEMLSLNPVCVVGRSSSDLARTLRSHDPRRPCARTFGERRPVVLVPWRWENSTRPLCGCRTHLMGHCTIRIKPTISPTENIAAGICVSVFVYGLLR